MSSSGPDNFQISVHMYGQTFTWCILVNFTILFALLKFNKIAVLLHGILGATMIILTYFFILWFLAPYGFIQSQKQNIYYYLHAILGCAMLGLIVIQCASGLFSRIYQNDLRSDIFKLRVIKGGHKYFGYFLSILFKINIIWNWYGTNNVFYFLVCWQFISIVTLFYLKFFLKKMQATIYDRQVKDNYNCQIIQNIQDLPQQKQIIIFANYVYDASQLQKLHPGGHKVIESILGRQVDRFLYGMYSSQLFPELPSHSHSAESLILAGKPIGKFLIANPFMGFGSEIVNVRVSLLNKISNKSLIFALGLISTEESLQFKGYTSLKQLGQYYSLTLNGKVTRLYTTVNFLSKDNIVLMNKIFMKQNFKLLEPLSKQNRKISDQIQLKNNDLIDKNNFISQGQHNYVPIMLKIYQTGKFTSVLKKCDFITSKLQLSAPKGRGLQLDSTNSGRIVIVAGGTGLFPFSDLIDLLFKAQLIEEKHQLSNIIIQQNPLLKQKPFSKYTFVLLAAINDPQDLHPITLQQLIKLNKHQAQFKVVMRVSKNQVQLTKLSTGFQFSKDYFTKRVLLQAATATFSRVWICGPPKMVTDTARKLIQNNFPLQKMLLL